MTLSSRLDWIDGWRVRSPGLDVVCLAQLDEEAEVSRMARALNTGQAEKSARNLPKEGSVFWAREQQKRF